MEKIIIGMLLLLTVGCSPSGEKKEKEVRKYRNPILAYSVPDPTVIKAEDGMFYLYATEDIRNMPIFYSRDMVEWTLCGSVFAENSRPDFEPGGGLWAPDINFIGGRYVLYYSMSKWGGVESCGIGVAIADKPAGPFQDLGILFRSSTIGVTNSIDPFYIHDQGKNYLFWGSFHGIFGIELSEDGLSLKEGAEKKQIAGTAFEATYIHKKGKYYYFFGSIGTCCEGVNSTYTTVVGRAENLWGPYTDKSGRLLLENYFEVFLHGNDVFAGTGHNSEIVTDDAGKDWIFYHAFDRRKPGGRVLMLDRVEWEKGWPSVRKEEPALEAEVPFIEMKTVKE
ncbi:family 43 glycosylhydrolase [Odoribacter laneus]|uniref:family 43 glycosylhydrolase n=1 Tax=Odoribacter laneus TaxID=626933 RepID=UPI00033DF2D7|nr:arabinan endo-1 5-alpha-L-arabinosidase [Odoribacter laneus CAG:561]